MSIEKLERRKVRINAQRKAEELRRQELATLRAAQPKADGSIIRAIRDGDLIYDNQG